jgi:predicted DNA-binding antitoxin AbrB/MazE fold protein
MSMKTIRVRVHAGHLEPLEKLVLPEGTEVSVQFETPTAGSPAAVLSAMRSLPELEPSAVDELERAIEEGRLPVRAESVFDRPEA